MKRSESYAGASGLDQLFRALGDPHRLKILCLLKEKDMSAGEILGALDIVQSTLSHHMKSLTEAGLVSAARQGKWTWYTLSGARLDEAGAFLKSLSGNNVNDSSAPGEIRSEKEPAAEVNQNKEDRKEITDTKKKSTAKENDAARDKAAKDAAAKNSSVKDTTGHDKGGKPRDKEEKKGKKGKKGKKNKK